MCLMCDITGRDYYHNHSGNKNTPIKTKDNNNSEEKTLNFNDGNNIIVLDNNNTTFRGLEGDDVYIISQKTVNKDAKIKILDTNGNNTIQLVENLKIIKSLFTSDATRLTLDNGSVITINGADKFTFELSGNVTTGIQGTEKTFEEFAKFMGLNALPSSGTENGNENITITNANESSNQNTDRNASTDSRAIKSNLTNFPLNDLDKIDSNQKIEIDLNNYFIAPKISAYNSTDLSNLVDLKSLDVIVIDQTNAGTKLAVRHGEAKAGLKLLDLDFLNIDPDSILYQVWGPLDENNLEGDGYWRDREYSHSIWDRFDVSDGHLSLAENSYFDLYKSELLFEFTSKNDDGSFEKPYLTSNPVYFGTKHNIKIKLLYTSEGVFKDHTIIIDSIFNDDLSASDDIEAYKEKIDSISHSSLNYEIMDISHPYFTRDQILLDGSKLTIEGGVDNAEVFPVYFKIRSSVVNSDDYEYKNPEDGYSDLELTVMMTDDDYVRTQSSKIIKTEGNETSVSIVEDNPGDILLDLSDFNIDPGTAKIKNVKINYSSFSEPLTNYTSDIYFDDTLTTYSWYEIFYIDENFLKFTEGAIYDYDNDNIRWLQHSKNGEDGEYGYVYATEYPIVDVRKNDFEIIFTYESNNEEFEHTLKIEEYTDTDYGSFIHSDHVLKYDFTTTENKFINALNSGVRWPHLGLETPSYLIPETEWTNYETVITYSFPNIEKAYIGYSSFEPTGFYEAFQTGDRLLEFNETAKNMYREILNKTSEIFKITFKEVSSDPEGPNGFETAHIRFFLVNQDFVEYAGWASFPWNKTNEMVLVVAESDFDDPEMIGINPNGYLYSVVIHELGHSLGLTHPFDGYPDYSYYAESYYANTLFTQMSYATFWDKTFDIYSQGNKDGKYLSFVVSSKLDTLITPDNWQRDDILTLGYKYGLRENYNADDTTYKWGKDKNIFDTIHDMGGNDTIDLSNYDNWDMNIDLNPGGVSEVGTNQERLIWDEYNSNSKTGDVFVLSWSTIIENYTGSNSQDIVKLNQSISNNIQSGSGSDIIRNALSNDIISTGSNDDTIYVSIRDTLEINNSINIDGGEGSDWLIIEGPPKKINSLENIYTVVISKNNDKAVVAVKEFQKGLEILDLSFLDIDEGSLKITEHYYNAYYMVIEDPPVDGINYYWWDEKEGSSFFEIENNSIKLTPRSYFSTDIEDYESEYTDANLNYEVTQPDGGKYMSSYPTQNWKTKLEYTSNNIKKEYILEFDSFFNNETPYSKYSEYLETDTVVRDLDFNLTDLLTHFDNIENFDFTNNEKNTITITEDTFQLSNKTKIKGDENDKITLPDNALQINSDDLYLYYALNDNEIGISVDMIIV